MSFASLSITELNQSFVQAATNGDLEQVLAMLSCGDPRLNPQTNDSEALVAAAMGGHLEVVKTLIPVSSPRSQWSRALTTAATNGHLEIVNVLLPVSDPKANNNMALRFAASKEHIEIMKVLIPLSGNDIFPHVLREASSEGAMEVIRTILPHVNPKKNASKALRYAAISGQKEAMILLLPLSSVAAAKKVLVTECCWSALDFLAQEVPATMRQRWLNEYGNLLPITVQRQATERQQKTTASPVNLPSVSRPRSRC